MKISSQIMDRARDGLPKAPLINVGELGQYIKRKRERERLSLRAVAKQTQVSASTLSRIENGTGIPDTPTLARLARWLNIPFERIVTGGNSKESPIVYYPQESVPDIVAAHLRADRNLTPDQARALEDMFRIAYNQLSVRK
jgi:transcriptional regulator with XRE-family HTH domain